MKKKTLVLCCVIFAIAGLIAGYRLYFGKKTGFPAEKNAKISYITTEVKTGDVVSSISASGTIEPEELIDVGSQVSGQILEFGKDAAGADVDYCSVVTNGMILAKIDDVTYVADLNVARAQLNNSESSVAVAKANLISSQAKLKQAERDWNRAVKIGVGDALSQSSHDSYEAAYDVAKADILVKEAAILQAEASVVQARASVEKAERNLGYCTISSPVDGVVIDRRVNKGQTIVSSMSASSLFLIATDLRKIQIWVAVNEADVGELKPGTPVSFSVDAFPGKTFRGTVRRVRLNATVTSNVVTYTVEVETENPDGLLLPYLTANVQFETESRRNVLTVPARALRRLPAGAPEFPGKDGEGTLFISGDNGIPRPVKVKVLLSNGTDAAVESDELKDGVKVVIGTRAATQGANEQHADAVNGASEEGGTKNPFMPNMPKPPKGRNGPPPA